MRNDVAREASAVWRRFAAACWSRRRTEGACRRRTGGIPRHRCCGIAVWGARRPQGGWRRISGAQRSPGRLARSPVRLPWKSVGDRRVDAGHHPTSISIERFEAFTWCRVRLHSVAPVGHRLQDGLARFHRRMPNPPRATGNSAVRRRRSALLQDHGPDLVVQFSLRPFTWITSRRPSPQRRSPVGLRGTPIRDFTSHAATRPTAQISAALPQPSSCWFCGLHAPSLASRRSACPVSLAGTCWAFFAPGAEPTIACCNNHVFLVSFGAAGYPAQGDWRCGA